MRFDNVTAKIKWCNFVLKALTKKVHFAVQLYFQNLYVSFVYQGHLVKVKVTGAIKSVSVRCKPLQSEAGESWQSLSYGLPSSERQCSMRNWQLINL